jgi:hypothetical protein
LSCLSTQYAKHEKLCLLEQGYQQCDHHAKQTTAEYQSEKQYATPSTVHVLVGNLIVFTKVFSHTSANFLPKQLSENSPVPTGHTKRKFLSVCHTRKTIQDSQS